MKTDHKKVKCEYTNLVEEVNSLLNLNLNYAINTTLQHQFLLN